MESKHQIDQEVIDTLNELLACCMSWDPDVRILGNVRAQDATRAIIDVLDYVNQSPE